MIQTIIQMFKLSPTIFIGSSVLGILFSLWVFIPRLKRKEEIA